MLLYGECFDMYVVTVHTVCNTYQYLMVVLTAMNVDKPSFLPHICREIEIERTALVSAQNTVVMKHTTT